MTSVCPGCVHEEVCVLMGREYIITEEIIDNALAYGSHFLKGKKKRELVRCRDCKHYDGYGECALLSHELEGRYDCLHSDRDWYVKPDDYCAWAERREA